jgi:SAM-dependent methyltransferase
MTTGPKRIFDAKAQALHRARAAHMDGERFLWREAAEGMGDRIAPLNRRFARALAIELRAADALRDCANEWRVAGFDAAERLETEGGFDLIVSILSLHGMNDLPGALAQIRRTLAPGGFFVAALFGGETLKELRYALAAGESDTTGGASPRVIPFADVRDLGALMVRAGFIAPVADSERTVARYRDFSTLVRDLRLMGETSALAERRSLSRAALAAALARHAEFADADGRLPATFDIVYLTGWAI